MTEKDMARIDGKDYDIRKICNKDCRFFEDDCESNDVIVAGDLCLIPRLKQTGWVCKYCAGVNGIEGTKCKGCLVTHCDKPNDCPVSRKIDNFCGWPMWEPFYGKVFQE
jgi:hypothetical protein